MKRFRIAICGLLCLALTLTGCNNVNSKEILLDSAERLTPALQAYVLEDYGIEYSAEEMVKRILFNVSFENSLAYVVIQLPYKVGSIIHDDIDSVRIVRIEMNDAGHDVASAYSGAFALDSTNGEIDDAPYTQCVLPPIEDNYYVVVTKVHDLQYGVYLPPNFDEKIKLNGSGIFVTNLGGAFPPGVDDLPKVLFDGSDDIDEITTDTGY